MSKEIRIKWISDESDLDKSVQNLQRKLQQINKTSSGIQNIQDQGGQLSSRAQYAQKAFQRSSADLLQKESRELEQRQRMENQGLLQKQRELIKLQKTEGSITEEKRKQIQLLKEEIQLRSKNVMDLEVKKKEIETSINNITGKSEMDRQAQTGAAGGAGGGGRGGLGGIVDGIKGFFSKLNPGLIFAAAGSALKFGSALTRNEAYEPTRALQNQAQSAKSTTTRDLQRLDSGSFIEDLFFAGQEKKAVEAAQRSRSLQKASDYMDVGGNLAFIGAGSAMAFKGARVGATAGRGIGAGIGALAGSVIPGAGTAAGAAVGSGIGTGVGMLAGAAPGLATAGVGLMNMVSNPDQLNAAGSMLGIDYFEDRYNNKLNRQMTDTLSQQRESRRELEAEEKFGLELLQKNMGNMIGLRRATGMTSEDVMGGMGIANELGFDRQSYMQTVGQLAQSGGSQMAQDQGASVIAMQAERLGLSGAGGMLGQISRSQETPGQAKREFIEMLAEGSRMGMDSSKLPQETAKFSQAVVSFAQKAGVQDISSIAREMASMLKQDGNIQMADLERLQGAQQRVEGLGKQAGGPRGLERFMRAQSALGGNESFKKMEGTEKREIMNQLMTTERSQLLQDSDLMERLGFEGDQEGFGKMLDEINLSPLGDRAKELQKSAKEKLAKTSDPKERERIISEFRRSARASNSDLFSGDTRQDDMIARRMLGMGEQAATGDLAARYGATATEDMNLLKQQQEGAMIFRPGAGDEARDRLSQFMPKDKLESILAAQGKGQSVGTGLMGDVLPAVATATEGITQEAEGAGKVRDFAEASSKFLEIIKTKGEDAAEGMSKLADALNRLADSTTPEKTDAIINKLVPGFFGGGQ